MGIMGLRVALVLGIYIHIDTYEHHSELYDCGV